jgi:hypothetical protein
MKLHFEELFHFTCSFLRSKLNIDRPNLHFCPSKSDFYSRSAHIQILLAISSDQLKLPMSPYSNEVSLNFAERRSPCRTSKPGLMTMPRVVAQNGISRVGFLSMIPSSTIDESSEAGSQQFTRYSLLNPELIFQLSDKRTQEVRVLRFPIDLDIRTKSYSDRWWNNTKRNPSYRDDAQKGLTSEYCGSIATRRLGVQVAILY